MPIRASTGGQTVQGGIAFLVRNGYYYQITGTIAALGTQWTWQIQNGNLIPADVTASRSLATTYQNTSGTAMFLLPQLGSASNTVSILHDTSSPPTNSVWTQSAQVTSTYTPWAIIPNNHYYQVTSSGASILKWIEWSMPLAATRTDKTSSRTLGTVYQNTGSESLFAVPLVHDTNGVIGGRYTIPFYHDSASSPTLTENAYSDTASGEAGTVAGLVGVNYYYKVPSSGGSTSVVVLDKWWEYTFTTQLQPPKNMLQFALP
jgi:hypothetical protein